ncbi:MAG: FtsX-like permease family protein [Steroidobacteraceae bacterium]
MLRHYLQMAVRGFARHKLYSLINLVGLSVAFACAILILLFVRYQLSYDAWIPDTSNLYRLEVTLHMIGRPPLPEAKTPLAVLEDLQSKIPQVEAITYLAPATMTVTVGHRQFLETVTGVDSDLLQVIKLPLVSGDPAHVLSQPGSVVLSQAMARKFFGDTDPVGKLMTVRGPLGGGCTFAFEHPGCSPETRTLEVTGVLRDLPRNTQLVAGILVPDSSSAGTLAWKYGSAYGYVRLIAGARPPGVLQELKPILDATFHIKVGNIEQTASQLEHFHLTRFRDVHLMGGRYGGMTPAGSPATVYGFAIIALLIVLIAAANFMNLATARATLRAREIGLRKLGGATRGQLIVQFLSEAVLMSVISLAVALALVEVMLPAYDRLLVEPIGLHYLADWQLLAAIVGGTVGLGLLGGAYPALVLSRFRPAEALRGGTVQTGAGVFRSALVLGQFAVSIGLGVAAMVIFRQINFARELDLGFNRHHVLVIGGMSNIAPGAREGLMRALRSGPGIIATALSDDVPFQRGHTFTGLLHAQGSSQVFSARFIHITVDYPSLYGVRLVAGRLLSPMHGQDVSSGSGLQNILINAETARRLGGSPAAAVGRMLVPVGRIVGVLADTKMRGVRVPVLPTIYLVDPVPATHLFVKVSGGELSQTLAFINRTWRSWAPGIAMDRYFLGSAFNDLFTSDESQGTVLALFVALGIFIACLGLFGLTVFTAERHTKEIGIRKVSGARTHDIMRLLLWRISVPVLLANVIAWPVAYYCLHRWLEGYAYRISPNPVYFLAAGAAALLVAWATVFLHTLRLARTSPVHALRYE